MLKQFEKRLRAVEKAQMADDVESYLVGVTESINLHTAVAALCENIAAMQAPYLPRLLQDHADGVIARATMQQVRSQTDLDLHRVLSCRGKSTCLHLPSHRALGHADPQQKPRPIGI